MNIKSGIWALVLILGTSQAALIAASVDATVTKVTGTAYVTTPSGHTHKIHEGDKLPVGSSIRTEADSTVGLQLVPGSGTVVAPETSMSITALNYSKSAGDTQNRTIRLNLQKGTLFSALAKHDGNSDFRISTPAGVAAARGTGWSTTYEPAGGGKLTISVANEAGSSVTVTNSGGTTTVNGGQTGTATNGGSVVISGLSAADAAAIAAAINASGTGVTVTVSTGTVGGVTTSIVTITAASNPANNNTNPPVSP